ncbi:hypothetical protein VOLCADRAFT_107850 [Volvox carteri f. nagariensis]|uniref:P-type ATPase A domain-containing protein n=1 Tax=Volvox carteri f. nagariensis TaxID=3068 RepID=D8UGV0_VOLCA|nr:uncharacterized protein VOLCADRAFT_107850 [Volvox carteri f. nagariensis]EFJ41014.1 hypothetical protein VOLCADRAFT_107850 [Volvox carteri f. nagariensis]|eukprot:XP_002957878.1 hypothetical protein VOLCADRAFT_107850 [Volvox carteri f. nagariensis]
MSIKTQLAATYRELFTYHCYGLGVAALLNILAHLFTHWSIRFRAFVSTSNVSDIDDAEVVLVVPVRFNGSTELVPLDRKYVKEGLMEVEELSFDFRRQRFVYNPAAHAFEKLRFPDKETFETYGKASGHGTEAKQLAAFDRYGLNRVDVPLPAFSALMKEHLVAPFFVFQVFCVMLWMLDEYFYYSLFTLFMLVTFESTVVGQRLRNLKELRSLQTPKQNIYVYRCGKWEQMPGDALLPGDVISIGRPLSDTTSAGGDKVVPADCLLVAGSCIAEEAVLTGESTPQWKSNIGDQLLSESTAKQRLSSKQHKHHILFGGTKILQHTGDKNARIRTPDGGCLAVVLRTGFETAQGRLMRTILFSTERVTANNAEAGLFIAFLLLFALSAAYYVLVNGLQDPTRSRFKLILNCIMIVTSVIPPELPMELSLAVNASLLALARKKVFCTEPFRIPFAGKVEVCCFDKTGTLTSDHLLLEGLVGDPEPRPPPPPGSSPAREGGGSEGGSRGAGKGKDRERRVTFREAPEELVPDGEAGANKGPDEDELADPALVKDPRRFGPRATLVLAACHSLVQVATGESGGSAGGGSSVATEVVGDPLEKAALESVGWTFVGSNGGADVSLSPEKLVRATLLHRFHFSSHLKRMSAMLRVEDDTPGLSGSSPYSYGGATAAAQSATASGGGASGPQHVVVAKGAPEVLKGLLASVPPDYDSQYKRYAAEGARVIALAHKALPADLDAATLRSMPREAVESKLNFVGFAIFQCPLKPESEPALAALAASSHQLVMITGDAPLTACYAASRVHIVTRPVLVLGHVEEDKGHAGGDTQGAKEAGTEDDSAFCWSSPDESVRLPFSRDWDDMLRVASEYDLAVSGDALAHATAVGVASQLIPLCQVFARVSPDQKELVVNTLRAQGFVTLMCGDGTNDVGGLKAAHVGVALLSASESAAKRAAAKKAANKKDGKAVATTASGAGGPRGKAAPGTGPGGKRTAGQELLARARAANQPITPRMEAMARMMDNMENSAMSGMDGDMPMLKPGDASMASPFTAKAVSVLPCTDIIKQGRCTLVTTVQMFKILGLTCLSTAYSLSVLYLQGVKLSDTQATVSGMLSAAQFLFISQAKPLETMSPVRPHPTIFNPYFFGSLLGQFGVHLGLLIYFYRLSLGSMPDSERLSSESEFKPNLVNTVCYLVQAVVQMMTFAVNYVGHPFNTSIVENRNLFNSLRISAAFLFVVAAELVPGLNSSFGMVPIPHHIKVQLVGLSFGAFLLTWHLERILRALFPAPVPPPKGYQSYTADLRRLGLTEGAAEKKNK